MSFTDFFLNAGPLLLVKWQAYSIPDNMPATGESTITELPEHAALVDPPTGAPSASDDKPLMPAPTSVCLAASHQVLWQWRSGSWQGPACNM